MSRVLCWLAGPRCWWCGALALVVVAGCGTKPSVPAERVLRTFLVSYSDGASDTIRAEVFFRRGWNDEAIEFMSGWSSVAYISRPATVRELP